ncbi:disulfide bond formation protein B [Oceanobacter mangrovi]|uniref:disulfide bond formation protein B n=1 Tax=Oceanobacter mangrovi TaxID=2862510 RepID=UPI001C8EFE0A|nr:disulfide bond formation protein B [Oceanobacter mangrovi]
MSPTPLRWLYLAGFFICAALLGTAYYFEIVEFMEPCPLCMAQRFFVLLVGVFCLLAFLFDKFRWPSRLFLGLGTASAIGGAFVSDHHVWIQSLPPEDVPACGPSFEYLMETLPLDALIQIMLSGDGNCADISWMYLGISMPGWMRLIFILFALVGFAALVYTWRRSNRKLSSW